MDNDNSNHSSTVEIVDTPERNNHNHKRLKCDCDMKRIVRKRVPIIEWLPKYRIMTFFQDLLAGFTVSLTEIPQGIAFAVVAGFIVDFFSYPIIAGFTTAAALNIACSQLTGLLGLPKKGESFLKSWEIVFANIGETRKWDTILGISGIIVLVLMKEMAKYGSIKDRPEWSRGRNIWGKFIFFLSLARNALVVLFGTALAYYLSKAGETPFNLTKTVEGGVPPFEPPPFSTQTNDSNGTIIHHNFEEMVQEFGSTIPFTPLIALLESVAIAKAFSKGKALDVTQEMLALGICNILGSFVKSMPVTGSFTRTAVNNASGVRTTVGGMLTGVFVLLALQFLTEAFYYIPKATLASVVIAAMFYLCDFQAFVVLWKTKRLDLIPFMVTLVACLFINLEYGILIGIAVNLISVLYSSARPKIIIEREKLAQGDVFVVTPRISLLFPSAEYIREIILAECQEEKTTVIVNGKHIGNIDATVAKSFSVLNDELKLRNQKLLFWNMKSSVQTVLTGNNRSLLTLFRDGNLEDIVDDPRLERNGDTEAPAIQV